MIEKLKFKNIYKKNYSATTCVALNKVKSTLTNIFEHKNWIFDLIINLSLVMNKKRSQVIPQ